MVPSTFSIAALLGFSIGVLEGQAQSLPVTFRDVTVEAGIAVEHRFATELPDQLLLVSGGAASGDVNGDGWPDLYIVGGDGDRQHLFINRADGTFDERAVPAGVAAPGERSCGPAFADIDGDGDLDLFVGMLPRDVFVPDPLTPAPSLYVNDGTGTFTEVARQREMFPFAPFISATFGDYDGDGFLDLFTSHWAMPSPFMEASHLWRNDGMGTFVPVDAAAGLEVGREDVDPRWSMSWSFAANFADIDSDGRPDLLVASDFGHTQVFRNLGDGRFVDISTDVLTDENGMGTAVGDFDNDGHLDWFVTSIFDPEGMPGGRDGTTGNRLYRNLGDGTFEDATEGAGVREGAWGWGACAADFDNDGWLDLFHVNGWGFPFSQRFSGLPAVLFWNNGNGTFREGAAAAGIADRGEGRGVVCFDYDRDGDIDVLVANITGPVRLYRNELDGRRNYLQVKLVGRPPNTEAIGARVYLRSGEMRQLRELRAGTNYVSQDPAVAHFGLGMDDGPVEIEVQWPRGARTVLAGLTPNRHLVVFEAAGDANCDGASSAADLISLVRSISRGPVSNPCPSADVNYDGRWDHDDIRSAVGAMFVP